MMYLHKPVKVMIQTAGVCLIYFYYWQEIFTGYKNLILAVQQARQKYPSATKVSPTASSRLIIVYSGPG
jgi:undecaprenyl pyrophosphate phosphatase UppP